MGAQTKGAMAETKFINYSSGMKILAILEFAICSSALLFSVEFAARAGWAERAPVEWNILLIHAIVFALMSQIFSLSLGLFNPKLREPYRAVFRRMGISISMGAFVLAVLSALFADYSIPTQVLVLAVFLSLAVVASIRYLDYNVEFLAQKKINVLVLGAGERAAIIERRMKRRVDRQRFNLHGFVVMRGDSESGIQKEKKLTLEGSTLADYIRDNNIDEIVVASDERRNNLPLDILFDCKLRGTNIIEILDFIERETGQVAVNLVYPAWVIYSNGFSSTHDLRNALDWSFNALLAIIVFFFTWPFILLTWIAIKLEDGPRAPARFTQERIGLDGRIFRLIKFRSMTTDAEKDGPVWTSRDDARVTRVGKFIRKYRIDELPQLYNVIRGDMGFVGPRPERPEFVKELITTIPYYNQRHNVKPGLTGWAQLKYPYGASETDAMEKLKFDLYYVKHRSFLFDLHILVQTVEVILFGKGR